RQQQCRPIAAQFSPARLAARELAVGHVARLPAAISALRMQALKWPGPTASSGGTTLAHASMASGQRVRKTQPEGGLAGLGMSPLRICRTPCAAGSGDGTAESRALV